MLSGFFSRWKRKRFEYFERKENGFVSLSIYPIIYDEVKVRILEFNVQRFQAFERSSIQSFRGPFHIQISQIVIKMVILFLFDSPEIVRNVS